MTTLNKDLAAVQLSQVQLQEVIEQLNNLEDYEIIAIHNDYCEVNNDSYNHIIDNDDDEAIDNLFNTPSAAIIAASFGDYNHSHDYFILNGYGNLVSFNYITDDKYMLTKLGNFLMVDLDNDSYEDNVYDVMTELNNYSYEQIQEIITMLGIDYQ